VIPTHCHRITCYGCDGCRACTCRNCVHMRALVEPPATHLTTGVVPATHLDAPAFDAPHTCHGSACGGCLACRTCAACHPRQAAEIEALLAADARREVG